MRLMEGIRLRTKDVDFDHHVIVVREAKDGKDRVVNLAKHSKFTHKVRAGNTTAQAKVDQDVGTTLAANAQSSRHRGCAPCGGQNA